MRSLFVVLAVTLLPLAGCPQPDDGPPGNVTPTLPDGGAPPSSGAAAPGDAASTAPPTAAPMGEPSAPTPPPGFASLIKDGKSVTLSGKLVGATKAQVDFAALGEKDGEKAPEMIEIVQVTDGTFSMKVPATYDKPIYVTAAVVSNGAPSATDPGGMFGPVTLEGKDVAVEIKVEKSADWRKSLPWFREGDPGGALPPGGASGPAVPEGTQVATPVEGGGAAPPPGAPPAPGAAAPGGAGAAPGGAAPGGAAPPAAPK